MNSSYHYQKRPRIGSNPEGLEFANTFMRIQGKIFLKYFFAQKMARGKWLKNGYVALHWTGSQPKTCWDDRHFLERQVFSWTTLKGIK